MCQWTGPDVQLPLHLCVFVCMNTSLVRARFNVPMHTWGWATLDITVLCVCFWLLYHPPAETLNCGQTHVDWRPSIMHMGRGSGSLRYHQGQLVCPCWKPPPPISTDGWLQFPILGGRQVGMKYPSFAEWPGPERLWLSIIVPSNVWLLTLGHCMTQLGCWRRKSGSL